MHKLWQRLPVLRQHFTTSSVKYGGRALVYSETGNPSNVLSVITYPRLAPPVSRTLNVKFLLSPINPADINVIEGRYPSKPAKISSLAASGKGSPEYPVFVGGNEGLAEVMDVGDGITTLMKGDWVVITKPQCGTWATLRNVHVEDVLKVPRAIGDLKLSEVNGATITVNPPTAYNMLHDFTDLGQGDWVLQNGANSSVGQAVIQIAAARGFKTLNFIRNRPNLQESISRLVKLGATHVLTYDDLSDKQLRDKVNDWTGGKDIRLALNCVGGKETTLMTRFLGRNACLVSYGAMSKQPLSLPTSLFIFKNLTAKGFWQSGWYADHSREEREKLIHTLAKLMMEGKLKEPEHEIITIRGKDTNDEAADKINSVIAKMAEGQYGKKALLRLEETE